MKKIDSGGYYSRIPLAERKQSVEKAEKSGLKNTIKSYQDIVKRSFLYDIAGSHDEKFLKDVLVNYRNTYQYKGNYKGKCGKNIASKEYISYHEKAIFNKGLGSDFYKDYKYKDYIIKHLTELVDPFMYDLQQITNENDRKRFQAIIKDLEKCGAKMSITYYGNPNIPKPVTYRYKLSKRQTKLLASIIKLTTSYPFGIIYTLISIGVSLAKPIVGVPNAIFAFGIQITEARDWSALYEVAEQGVESEIKITGIEDKSKGVMMIQKIEINALNKSNQ